MTRSAVWRASFLGMTLLGVVAVPAGGADVAGGVSVPLPPIDLRLIEEGKRLPIDLPTAAHLALASNLEIRDARARIAEAAGDKNRALGALLPSATISFFAGEIDGQIQGSFGNLEQHTFGTINPAGRLTFTTDPGAALFDLLARYRSLDATTERADAVTQDTLLAAATGYFTLERAQARVAIAEQAVAVSQELVRVSADREQLGNGLQVDLQRAEAQLAADRGLRVLRQQQFREASVRLALTTKLDPAVTLFPLETVVAPRQLVAATGLRELIDRAVAGRPELKDLANRAAAADQQVQASWWKALGPKVGGFVEESAIGKSFGDLGNRQIYGGFIGWELAPGTIGEVQVSRARRDQAAIQVERAQDVVTSEVVRAHEGVRAAAEQIEVGHTGVEAAQASLDLSQSRYEGGVGLALEVLEAQRALTAARTSLVTAIQAHSAAQVRLLRATGELSVSAFVR